MKMPIYQEAQIWSNGQAIMICIDCLFNGSHKIGDGDRRQTIYNGDLLCVDHLIERKLAEEQLTLKSERPRVMHYLPNLAVSKVICGLSPVGSITTIYATTEPYTVSCEACKALMRHV